MEAMDLALRVNSVTSDLQVSKPRRPRRKHLFQKILSLSDAGKNGKYVFVVPRRYAQAYFPHLRSASDSALLIFEDISGKCFQFRYRFEAFNKSFVFGAGWRAFVNEKKLQEGDMVSFDQGHDKKMYIRHIKHTPWSSVMTSVASSGNRQDVGVIPSDAEPLASTNDGSHSQFVTFSSSSRTKEESAQYRCNNSVTDLDTVRETEDDHRQSQCPAVHETVRLFGVNIYLKAVS